MSQDDASPPWLLAPLAEFSAPAPPPTQAVRYNLRNLWRQFLNGNANSGNFQLDAELQSVPDRLLDWIAPTPDWRQLGCRVLDSALEDWLALDPTVAQPNVVVSPPLSDFYLSAQHWAVQNDISILSSPSLDDILHNQEAWLEQVHFEPEKRYLLPRLERWYLRHHGGLTIMRGMLQKIWEEKPALVLVCDSWAWSYLCRVVQVGAIVEGVLTLAPFDGERLHRWLHQSTTENRAAKVRFRLSDTGQTILQTDEKDDAEGGQGRQSGAKTGQGDSSDGDAIGFMRELAVLSRGNPYLAWAIWRRSLQVAGDVKPPEKEKEEAAQDDEYTFWARPVGKLVLPAVSPNLESVERFILHSLLLHSGLTLEGLAHTVVTTPLALHKGLRQLSQMDLVHRDDDGVWSVLPLAYPSVRARLEKERFLCDQR